MELNEKQREKINKLLINRVIIKGSGDHNDIMESIENEIMPSIAKLIDICGGDSESNGMKNTPFRVVKAWLEMTRGYCENPKDYLEVQFNLDDDDLDYNFKDSGNDDIVIVKRIECRSVCEHHVLPVYGYVSIGYLPNKKVVGLSKIPRMVEGYAKRFQLQERLSDQIANALMEEMDAQGVIVCLEETHTCMTARGVEAPFDSSTVTISTRGVFRTDKHLEERFLQAIK